MPLIPIFAPWNLTNPTLPKMYWGVKSQEQLIAQLYCIIDYLQGYENDQTDVINANADAIAKLQEIADSIANGEYYDQYIDGLAKWIDENLVSFVARLTAYVFPGLNWDGSTSRIEFTVPEGWEFLNFRFVWVPEDYSYHIELAYMVDGSEGEQEGKTYDELKKNGFLYR